MNRPESQISLKFLYAGVAHLACSPAQRAPEFSLSFSKSNGNGKDPPKTQSLLRVLTSSPLGHTASIYGPPTTLLPHGLPADLQQAGSSFVNGDHTMSFPYLKPRGQNEIPSVDQALLSSAPIGSHLPLPLAHPAASCFPNTAWWVLLLGYSTMSFFHLRSLPTAHTPSLCARGSPQRPGVPQPPGSPV